MRIPQTFRIEKDFDNKIEKILYKGLEKEIRETIIAQRVEALHKSLQTKKYDEIIEMFIKTIISTITDEGFKQEVKQELTKTMNDIFLTPENMQEQAKQIAKSQYKSVKELDLILQEEYKNAKEKHGSRAGIFEEFKGLNKGRYEFFEKQDKIMANLVKIAEKEGVEKALEKETNYSVIREVFPTPEDYINVFIKSSQSAIDYLAYLTKIERLEEDNPCYSTQMDKALYELEEGILKAFNKYHKEIELKEIIKEAKEIYGKKFANRIRILSKKYN